jgi:hypothetical protein
VSGFPSQQAHQLLRPNRYTGTCERVCDIDPSPILEYVETVPLELWPQQDRLNANSPYPAMITNSGLVGYYESTQPTIDELMVRYPGCIAADRRLSVVVPGQKIFKHTDLQIEDWVVRIHIPIKTNSDSIMFILDQPYHMEVGGAYLVNTEVEHSLHNLGSDPRIHFFFDVRTGPTK